METAPIKPKMEALTLKEIQQTTKEITVELNQDEPRELPRIKIEAPEVSMDPLRMQTFILEGFTPGAAKNIVCVDREGIFVYSARPDTIRFESFTKFENSLAELKSRKIRDSRLTICLLNGFIFLIPKFLIKIFRLRINKKTGRIEEQCQILVPKWAPRYNCERLQVPSPQKSNTTKYMVQRQRRGPDKIVTLSENGFSHIMESPPIRPRPIISSKCSSQREESQAILDPVSKKVRKGEFETEIVDVTIETKICSKASKV